MNKNQYMIVHILTTPHLLAHWRVLVTLSRDRTLEASQLGTQVTCFSGQLNTGYKTLSNENSFYIFCPFISFLSKAKSTWRTIPLSTLRLWILGLLASIQDVALVRREECPVVAGHISGGLRNRSLLTHG